MHGGEPHDHILYTYIECVVQAESLFMLCAAESQIVCFFTAESLISVELAESHLLYVMYG